MDSFLKNNENLSLPLLRVQWCTMVRNVNNDKLGLFHRCAPLFIVVHRACTMINNQLKFIF